MAQESYNEAILRSIRRLETYQGPLVPREEHARPRQLQHASYATNASRTAYAAADGDRS